MAYISGDENYISACESGDIHTAVCRMVWPEYGWTGDLDKDKHIAKSTLWLGKPLRDIAKMFGHATNYMGSAFTMAKSSGVPRDQVEVFQAKYFAAFPKIKEWHLNVQTQLQIHGFIVNPFGRIRHFWKRHNDDATLREAVAYGPQSVVADVMNNGIIQLHKSDAPAEILAQIHDACLGQVPKALYNEELEARILKLLEYPLEVGGRKMVIPLDAAFGDNWKQISL
ncbi:hypothetical protein EBR96_10690 [bacterium]|nr:hypothetical protein [bacterium]